MGANPYQVLQSSAAWVDLSDGQILSATGPDPVEFLNKYNTQDLQGLPLNYATPGVFLTQKGKIVSDALILKLPDQLLILLEKGYGEKLLKHLEVFLSFAEVQLKDTHDQLAHPILLGPKGGELLAKALGESLPQPDLSSQGIGPIMTLQKENGFLFIFPSDRFGILGWEILCPASYKKTLQENILSAGATAIGKDTLEITRVEAGFPRIGIDMDENNLVAEVGLDQRATSFNKGCYLGQETTARVESQGHVNRQLTQLILDKTPEASPPFEVWQGEHKVGKLTSWIHSPKYGSPLSLALLQTKTEKSTDPLVIKTPSGDLNAKRL